MSYKKDIKLVVVLNLFWYEVADTEGSFVWRPTVASFEKFPRSSVPRLPEAMEERKWREGDPLSEDESRPNKKAKQEDTDHSSFDLLPVEMTGVILRFATGGTPMWGRLSKDLSDEELALCLICRQVCRQWKDLLPLPPLQIHTNRHITKKEAKRRATAVCTWAASRGDLKMLKWARENGSPWNNMTFAKGSASGNLDLLKYAKENGCPSNSDDWMEMASTHAAEKGHLEVLKWLREEGCPWSDSTCSGAAGGGHLEVLKWLREAGCPWAGSTCLAAAGGGHLGVLKWLRGRVP